MSPTNRFRLVWDFVLLCLIVYIACVTPYRLGFSADAEKFSTVYWFENTVDMFFIVDVFLNFRTGYMDEHNNLVTDPSKIAHRYSRTWLPIDIVSGVPFDLIELAMNTTAGDVKSAKALKILRISRMAKTLKSGLLSEAMEELMTSSTNRSLLRFLKLMLMTFFCCHFFACVFVYVGQQQYTNGTTDMTWIDRYTDSMPEGQVGSLYLTAFYMVAMTITTVGYGDVLPVTDAERALSVVVMMIGGVCYSYIIATMASIVNTMDASERQFNEKMDCIGSYCSKQNFPQQLLKRVRRYYKHYYKQRTALDESEILEGLSARLQEDVAQHLIGRIMTNVPVFKGVSTDQWARVLPVFKFIEFSPGEEVYKFGDAGREMYIVIKGQLYTTDSDGNELKTLSGGDYIGALTALDVEGYQYETLNTRTQCTCYMVSRDDLQHRLAADFSDLLETMQLSAIEDIYGPGKGLAYALKMARRKHCNLTGKKLKRKPSIMGRVPSDSNILSQLKGTIGEDGDDEPHSPLSPPSTSIDDASQIEASQEVEASVSLDEAKVAPWLAKLLEKMDKKHAETKLHIIQMGKNKSEDALQIKLLKDELAELKSEMSSLGINSRMRKGARVLKNSRISKEDMHSSQTSSVPPTPRSAGSRRPSNNRSEAASVPPSRPLQVDSRRPSSKRSDSHDGTSLDVEREVRNSTSSLPTAMPTHEDSTSADRVL